MASRKEEKERLRREREEAERAAKAAEARRKRLGLALGGLLAAAAIAAILAFGVLGGDDGGGGGDPGEPTSGAALPKERTSDLEEAVEAARCRFQTLPDEGNEHLASVEETFDDYKTNPPTSGKHRPMPAAAPDGVYPPGGSPDKENWVHTLEHGRVIFMYKPGTPKQRRDQLETLMNEDVDGKGAAYKTVLMENNTDMPYAVAAVAWRRWVVCEQFTDGVFDALRAFRKENVDSELAPEPEFPYPYTGA